MVNATLAEASRPNRVLVFSVDDCSLCLDLNRVEAVYQHGDVSLHAVKDASGASRAFLIHNNEPALAVDLRDAFGLHDILGTADRRGFLVVRSGSLLLALEVDSFVGVRDLSLRSKSPVATGLMRDGGLSVGHLVELEGRPHTILDPSRIISSSLRERLELLANEARAFCERETKITALISELRGDATVPALKSYARLTRRNGRTRAAAAARTVLKLAQQAEPASTASGNLAASTLLRDIISLSVARQTGHMEVRLTPHTSAHIFFDAGRITEASLAEDGGRAAFRRILTAQEGSYRFEPSDTPVHPARIHDATLWLLVETLEGLNEERRSRHRAHG